jgi:hypothetical protein
MHPDTRKHYSYGGGSNVVETGVSIVAKVEFDAHVSSTDPPFGPHRPHHFSFHLRKAKHKFPRRRGPHVVQKG